MILKVQDFTRWREREAPDDWQMFQADRVITRRISREDALGLLRNSNSPALACCLNLDQASGQMFVSEHLTFAGTECREIVLAELQHVFVLNNEGKTIDRL